MHASQLLDELQARGVLFELDAAASPDASMLIADIDIFLHDAGDGPRAAPHEMENCPLDDRLQYDSQT